MNFRAPDDLNAPKIEENEMDSKSSLTSSSGYSYPLEYDVEIEQQKAHPMVPKLNFNNKVSLKGG